MSYSDPPPPPPPPPPPGGPYGGDPYGGAPSGGDPYGGAPNMGGAGPAPSFPLSSWGRRVVASLIDGVIGAAILFIFLILGSILGAQEAFTSLGYIAWFAFWIWQMVNQGNTGQTIGKNAIGIKLVRESDAQPVGPGLSIGRGFVHIVDSLPCYVGYLWPLWDPKRQTFADKLLTTVVIDVPKA